MMSEWCACTQDGPLIILPEETLSEWEGDKATDFEFALDLADTDTGFATFRNGWIIVPGYGDVNIAFFNVLQMSAIVAVCIQCIQKYDSDYEATIRQEYASLFSERWTILAECATIAAGRLVACDSYTPGSANSVFWQISPGDYRITMAKFERPYGQHVYRNYYYRWTRHKDNNNDIT